jgi:hypothetical protein
MSHDNATSRIMKAIAVKSPQLPLAHTAAGGSQPLVAALASELNRDVIARVQSMDVRSIGGHSNVAIALPASLSLWFSALKAPRTPTR